MCTDRTVVNGYPHWLSEGVQTVDKDPQTPENNHKEAPNSPVVYVGRGSISDTL